MKNFHIKPVTVKYLSLAFTLTFFLGCATNGIYSAINEHEQVRHQVQLGQDKVQVLDILMPTQRGIARRFSKAPEQYNTNGKHVEVFFFRSQSFSDGIVTDDEFTPYVFEDGVLAAIGWTAIGGPKTQAQARDNNSGHHGYGRFGRFGRFSHW